MRRRKTTPNKSLKLLNNARGQLDAVIRLIHDDAAHVDILKQILATISLLRRSHTEILKNTWRNVLTKITRTGMEKPNQSFGRNYEVYGKEF